MLNSDLSLGDNIPYLEEVPNLLLTPVSVDVNTLCFNSSFIKDLGSVDERILVVDGFSSLSKRYGYDDIDFKQFSVEEYKRVISLLYGIPITPSGEDIHLIAKLGELGDDWLKSKESVHKLFLIYKRKIYNDFLDNKEVFISSEYGIDFIVKKRNEDISPDLLNDYVYSSSIEFSERRFTR